MAQRTPAYRNALAVLAVALFWSGLLVFLTVRGVNPVPPFIFSIALTIAATPFLLSPVTLAMLFRHELAFWALGYLLLGAISLIFGFQGPSGIAAMRERVTMTLFLFTMVGILSHPAVHRRCGLFLAYGGLVTVVLGAVDLLRPLTFSSVIGRAAGLYINPNIAAVALITSVLAAAATVRRGREVLITVLVLGSAMTLSRGGLLVMGVVAVMLLWTGRIRVRWLVAAIAAMALILTVTGLWEDVSRNISQSSLMAERLRVLTEGSSGVSNAFDDVSTNERTAAAALAWQLFLAHPFLGAGIGATTDWALSFSTHNIYLRHLAEHGVLGIWIYPVFAWAVAHRAPKVIRWPTAVAILLLGLISHNTLDEWPILLFAAWCAATPPLPLERAT
ncbi:MAG: O-antigen ligase family protein [Gemmatimonadota bacterium]